jgi:hypothetical protein
MIITTSNNVFAVDVKSIFTPYWSRGIKFYESFSGKTLSSDRGINSDKFGSTFTIVGAKSEIENIANDITREISQITIQLDGEPIFGTAIDYSLPFVCNVVNKVSYPIVDFVTAELELTVSVVSPIVYLGAVPSTLPELIYDNQIARDVNYKKTAFSSPSLGDYGLTVVTDGIRVPLYKEVAVVNVSLKSDKMSQLQKFLSIQRGDSFTLTTSNIKLFLNSTSSNVIVTNFTYSRSNLKLWKAELKLAKA